MRRTVLFLFFLAVSAGALWGNPFFSAPDAGNTDSPSSANETTVQPAPVRSQAVSADSARTQKHLREKMGDLLDRMAHPQSPRERRSLLISLFLLSFAYGVFHASGPGHRKTLVFGLYTGRRAPVWEPALTSFLLAFLHGGSAVILILLFKGVEGSLGQRIDRFALYMEGFSYLLIILLAVAIFASAAVEYGAFLKGRQKKARFSGYFLFLLSGLYPCPGAVLVLILSYTLGIPAYGLFAVAAMSLGMALPVAAAGYLAWFGREGIFLACRKRESLLHHITFGVTAFSSLFLIGFSIYIASPFFSSLIPRKPVSPVAVETEADLRTVTDLLGRTVTIPCRVETVATLNSAARLVVYAGAAHKLCGVTETDRKGVEGMPYSYVNKQFFSGLTLTGSGGSSDTVFSENLVLLDPDVVFAFTGDRVRLDRLSKQTSLPIIGLSASGMFADDFLESLTLIGTVTGCEVEAARVVEALKGWQTDLTARTEKIDDEAKPTVYMGGMGFRGPHGFDGTCALYPPFTVIAAAHIADLPGRSGPFLMNPETVAAADPDIIFLNPSNLPLIREDYNRHPDFYRSLKAVREGRLYSQVSYNYNSTNMEIAVADAYYAGTVLYPEAFADIDFAAKAEEIFETMLGCRYLPVLDAAGIGFSKLSLDKEAP